MYDSIEEMPILRFHKYNKLLLIDSGIGSDLTDFDKHVEKTIRYINAKTPHLAVQEMENLRQNIYFIQAEISPKYMAFAALIKSVNNKPCEDLSDDALLRLLKQFNISHGKLTDLLESVKKKIDEELNVYFAANFDDAKTKEYYDQLKRRTVAVLNGVINGINDELNIFIENITNELITYFKPQNFGKIEVEYDKQFDKMCLLLSQHLNVEPKKMTVLEYYNAFEYIKDEAKKKKKHGK